MRPSTVQVLAMSQFGVCESSPGSAIHQRRNLSRSCFGVVLPLYLTAPLRSDKPLRHPAVGCRHGAPTVRPARSADRRLARVRHASANDSEACSPSAALARVFSRGCPCKSHPSYPSPSFVIVHGLHVVWSLVSLAEADTPLGVDPFAVLTGSIPRKRLQSIAAQVTVQLADGRRTPISSLPPRTGEEEERTLTSVLSRHGRGRELRRSTVWSRSPRLRRRHKGGEGDSRNSHGI